MRICIFGVGAVGGHLAAKLAQGQDHRVSVIARPAQAATLAANGIQLLAGEHSFTARLSVFTETSDAGAQDLVIVALKATSIATLGDALAPLVGETTSVLFVGNGIPWWYGQGLPEGKRRPPPLELFESTRGLEHSLRPAHLLGGVVRSSNSVVQPGVVSNESPHNNDAWIGGVDARASSPVSQVASVLQRGGFNAEAVEDVRLAVWSKLTQANLATMVISLITRQPLGVILQDPGLFAMARALRTEGSQIAAAFGYPVPVQDDESFKAMIAANRQHKSSMLQDLESGRPLESDATLGALQAFARQAQLETPQLDRGVAIAAQLQASGSLA